MDDKSENENLRSSEKSGRPPDPMAFDMKELKKKDRLTRPEAAFYLDRRPQTLANWKGLKVGLKFHRLLGRVFYFRSELDAFIRMNEEVVDG